MSLRVIVAIASLFGTMVALTAAQGGELDGRVEALLKRREGTWRDMNVPTADGRTLHRLIVENKYTRALEIGTSTGHSGIWIAWALSKTGGKLITLEIDPDRHRQALANFKEAGLSEYIDARLGDAHDLVRQLPGPFDFVFSDADKDWYSNYLEAVWPKVVPGGMFTAHNVGFLDRLAMGSGIRAFLDALKRLPDGETTIDKSSSAGLSITRRFGAGKTQGFGAIAHERFPIAPSVFISSTRGSMSASIFTSSSKFV